MTEEERPRRVVVKDVIDTVAEYYGVPVSAIKGRSRSRHIVRPRQIVCLLARELTPRSLSEIGLHLDRRDHSTIKHGCDIITAAMARDADLARDIEYLTGYLKGREIVTPDAERLLQTNLEALEKYRVCHTGRDRKPPEPPKTDFDAMDDLSSRVRHYASQPTSVRWAE